MCYFLVGLLFGGGVGPACGREACGVLAVLFFFVPEVSGWAEGVYWALFAQGESCFAVFSSV